MQLIVVLNLGKQEAVDATVETLKVVSGPFSHWARVMVDICAYAGIVIIFSVHHCDIFLFIFN